MFYQNKLWMAGYIDDPVFLLPEMANRHGLITGATGTGKTTTVKVLAEAFSDAGVPVFVADVKGDVSGISEPGEINDNMQERIDRFGLAQANWEFHGYPATYWDVYAEKGIPVRASIYDMGSLLLSKIMDLSDAQEGVLNIVYRISKDEEKWIYDLKDLRSMVQYVGDHPTKYKTQYGNVTTASVGGIQRGLLKLEDQEANKFFGKPNLDIMDWIRCDENGRGMINVLNCEKLFQNHDLYASFLVWMLNELYNKLPEVGDVDKPKMVYFFDEAHLLFNINSKQLLEKVEQVVRLIRSKGVGVYFISQSPTDIPNTVMAQLGNKIQHALRAYTPADQKVVKAAAQSFVVNPEFDTEEVIPQLGTGEALVSFLDEKGVPSMVKRAFILPPQSSFGVLDDARLSEMIQTSAMGAKYNQTEEIYSAYEQVQELYAAEQALEADKAALENGQPIAGASAPAGGAAAAQGQTIMVNGQPQTISPAYAEPAAVQPDVQPQTAEEPKMTETQKEIERIKAEREALAQQQLENEKAELEKERAKLEKEKEKLEKQKEKKKTSGRKKKSEIEKIATSAGRTAVNTLIRKLLK